MKTLNDLINREEPGWVLVRGWISDASRSCEVLEVPLVSREEALVALQVTTRSPMGAIVYESAGIMVDHGWLRILGAGGHPRLKRSLPKWNEGRGKGFLLVADDAVGGFFAINGGALGDDRGNLYYLAPDSLDWFACKMTYSQFIVWALSPGLDKFYELHRWSGWQEEVAELSGDKTILFYPFLSCVGPSLVERSRKSVPIEEFYSFHYDQNTNPMPKD